MQENVIDAEEMRTEASTDEGERTRPLLWAVFYRYARYPDQLHSLVIEGDSEAHAAEVAALRLFDRWYLCDESQHTAATPIEAVGMAQLNNGAFCVRSANAIAQALIDKRRADDAHYKRVDEEERLAKAERLKWVEPPKEKP